MAIKFSPKQITTKVRDITVQVGRTGHLTPVAELELVEISGVEIKRASLHTEDTVKKKGRESRRHGSRTEGGRRYTGGGGSGSLAGRKKRTFLHAADLPYLQYLR